MPTWLTTLFASPWILVWLPAAALPILIHLWNRCKYREVSWAAMEYLLAALAKSTRRMRIEQLLLLAVRTLLILLAVLALAEPFLRSVASPLVRHARTHRVLVFDGSYSMASRFGEQRAFDMAKEAALQIMENGNEGDAYSLILMADTPRIVVGTAAYDSDEFTREIQNLQMPHGGADLPAALPAADRVVQQVHEDQPQLSRHHVFFLTDLGRVTWSDENRSELAQAEFNEILERLTDENRGAVEVVPVGQSVDDNVAITSLQTNDTFATVGQSVQLDVTLRSFLAEKSPRQMQLWVDGRQVDQQTVDVMPGTATPNVAFDYRFQSPGDHALEVRLDGDPLEVDNRRYLVLPVKEHLDALLVSGKRGSTVPIEAALDGGDFRRGVPGMVRPHVVAESALLELDLKAYDCVFLCNVGQFTANEAIVLHDYLQQGGGLITILGDQVQVDRYNRELTGVDGRPRVLPARIGEAISDGQYHYFDPLNYEHPLIAPWQGKPKTGLVKVPVLKSYRLELPEDSQARVALGLDTSDPLIVEATIGSGRSILIATDLSTASFVSEGERRPWSLIASWLNSQPFIENLWKAAVGGTIAGRNRHVGEPLTSPYESSPGDVRVEVSTPQGSGGSESGLVQADAGGWSFADTEISGIYTVKNDGDVDSTRKFAVNIDTEESDLERMSPENLPSNMRLRGDESIFPSMATSSFSPSGFALHDLLLYAIFGLLFFETFLAWWIGHRSA